MKVRRQEECKQNEQLRWKWSIVWYFHVKYFTSQLFCLNILWLKAINEITARQKRTSLCKHDVIKVCSIEYLTTQIELVLPTFFRLLDVHKIIEYLTLGLLKYLSQYNSLLFWPTLYIHKQRERAGCFATMHNYPSFQPLFWPSGT